MIQEIIVPVDPVKMVPTVLIMVHHSDVPVLVYGLDRTVKREIIVHPILVKVMRNA